MPIQQQRKPANEAAYQAELQRNRNPLGLRNMNLPSFADDYAHHGNFSYPGRAFSNNHEQNFFNAPGHRLHATNLEERGIRPISSLDVKDILEEIKSYGPKIIPAPIKAVVASNKFGYKNVFQSKEGRMDYQFNYDNDKYRGNLPRGWGTLEEICRASIFAKEIFFSQRQGFTGVLSFIGKKLATVNFIDKTKGCALKEGHTPLSRLKVHSRPQQCYWTRLHLTYDTYSRSGLSIDRLKEEPFNDKDAHSNENCVLCCNLANGMITWTHATHGAFFLQRAKLSNILHEIFQDPAYNYDAMMEEKYLEWARTANKRNDKMQVFFEEALQVITPDIIKRRFRRQIESSGISICQYSGLPLPPVHACKAFVASMEREFVQLPYLEENIIFVNCILNSLDNSRVKIFEKGKKCHLNDPELKANGSLGWNKTLVENVRKNFASEQGSEASESAASSWE